MGGTGPIYYQAIVMYSISHGMTVDETATLTRYVRALDQIYLEHEAAEREKEKKREEAKARQGGKQ